jgi:hypothetical protein
VTPGAGVALNHICDLIRKAASTRPQIESELPGWLNGIFVRFAGSGNFVAACTDMRRILDHVNSLPEMSAHEAKAKEIEARYRNVHRNHDDAWQKLVNHWHHKTEPGHLIQHKLRHCVPGGAPVDLETLFSFYTPGEPEQPPEPVKVSPAEVLAILVRVHGPHIVDDLHRGAHSKPPTTTDAKIRELVARHIDPEARLPAVQLIWPKAPPRPRVTVKQARDILRARFKPEVLAVLAPKSPTEVRKLLNVSPDTRVPPLSQLFPWSEP